MSSWPYNTQRWKRLRRLKLVTDPLCEICTRIGLVEVATDVDHREPISKGGDPFPMLEGLASLCHSHHSMKTAADKKGERLVIRGVDPLTGKPIDPEHPFNG
jgi:5-methylcytosine-specific restriction enzyme A